MTNGIDLVEGYIPGVLGRVIELHAIYYGEHWGFGHFFECKVASELSEFFIRYDPSCDSFWSIRANGQIEGAITVDGSDREGEGAHLRWFIVSDAMRGRGVGNRLIEAAIDSCRVKGYKSVYLWTFEGLDSARHLYEKAGFILDEQHKGGTWGKEVNEQRFRLRLGQDPKS